MPAPNFDKSAYHEIVCGVSGVSYEQSGCYYNIHGEYVKPSGRKRAVNIQAAMPGAATKGGAKALNVGAPTVPDVVADAARENAKAEAAEQAAG